MPHNFHMLFVTVATSLLLVACTSGTDESTSDNQDTLERIEIVLADEAEVLEPEELPETDTVDETDELSDIADEVEVTVEDAAEEAESTQEAIDPVIQLTIEKIVDKIGIDKETHTFLFNEAEDYIELEVREKKDTGTTPLVGKYRYHLDKDEILSMDYLTGEFIPYVGTEE